MKVIFLNKIFKLKNRWDLNLVTNKNINNKRTCKIITYRECLMFYWIPKSNLVLIRYSNLLGFHLDLEAIIKDNKCRGAHPSYKIGSLKK